VYQRCITADNPLEASAQYFPAHMRITGDSGATAGAATATIADDFSVHYENTFKVVNTFRGTPQTYILSICGAVGPRRYSRHVTQRTLNPRFLTKTHLSYDQTHSYDVARNMWQALRRGPAH